MPIRYVFIASLLVLTTGCNCGRTTLVETELEPEPQHEPTPLLDAGLELATIEGTVSEYAGVLGSTALHPSVPIRGALVHLDLDVQSTDSNGHFRFLVRSRQAHRLVYELSSQYEVDPDWARVIEPLEPGAVANADMQFMVKGLHFCVQNLAAGGPVGEASVSIVDEHEALLAGPLLTDAEGYVFFERTERPGTMRFSKRGFESATLGAPSVNTTHTTVGGMGLRPQ